MGKSYWILVWDGWGCGLNMINPRFLLDTVCPWSAGNGLRWKSQWDNCPTCRTTDATHRMPEVDPKGAAWNNFSENQGDTREDILGRHEKQLSVFKHWRIIYSDNTICEENP